MKKSDWLSALHWGLMCLPLVNPRTSSIAAVSGSMSARRYCPMSSVFRSLENRSVAKAIRLPSGDHDGCRSAKGSLVSRRGCGGEIVDKQIGQSAQHAGEADRAAVRRPRRVEDLVELGDRDFAQLVAGRASKIASAARPLATVATAICWLPRPSRRRSR